MCGVKIFVDFPIERVEKERERAKERERGRESQDFGMASSVYTSIQFKPINTKGKIANTVNGNGSKTLACELSREGVWQLGGVTVDQRTPPMTTYTNIRPKTAQGGGQDSSLDWDIAAGIIAVWHVVCFQLRLRSLLSSAPPPPPLPTPGLL